MANLKEKLRNIGQSKWEHDERARHERGGGEVQKVFVFGTGKLYKEKEDYIKDNFDVVGFLDNKALKSVMTAEDLSESKRHYEKTDYKGMDVPLCHPDDIKERLQDDEFIVLMSYQYVSMWRQLHDLGVGEERILFGIAFPPYKECEGLLFEDGRHLTAEGGGAVFYHFDAGEKVEVGDHDQLQVIGRELLRREYRKKYPVINAIAQMGTSPVSRSFGLERGKAIDRYYIEDFLEKNKSLIHGDCLEIAEDTYTLRYGEGRVEHSYMLHLEGWGDNRIKGNLETGEGIECDKYDCAIITQTLMFIFDIKKVAQNIYKMLKKNGSALLTVSGISPVSRYDADLWGSYYCFHEDAMRKLFEPLFGKENVKVRIRGNVKTAAAMVCGLCQEDLHEEDFQVDDVDYPVVITVVLNKK